MTNENLLTADKLEKDLLEEAQSPFLHNACNLSGLVHSFSEVTGKLWQLARLKNQGNDFVNTHKVTKLWICKLSELSGYEWMNQEEKSKLFA